MFYTICYENEDVSIIDTHVSKEALQKNLEHSLLEFFKSNKIELKYDDLFKESDTFWLVKNENGSISLYEKTTISGYIYNSIETREVRVYYIKSFNKEEKPKMNLGTIFNQQKSKLKKAVIVPQPDNIKEQDKDFNLIDELLKNRKFLNIRNVVKIDDSSDNSSSKRIEIDTE